MNSNVYEIFVESEKVVETSSEFFLGAILKGLFEQCYNEKKLTISIVRRQGGNDNE